LIGTPGLTVVDGDVTDRDALHAALGDASYVLHLAAIAGVSSYFDAPLRTMQVNYGGTQNLLSTLVGLDRLRLVVGFSTSEVYGPDARDASEEGRTAQGSIKDPRWVYAISKLAAEKLAYAYSWAHGVPICWVRPFNIYGPGQVGEGAVSVLIYRALRDLPLQITGDGRQVRAFCYIDDCCEAIDRCLTQPDVVQGETFNIGDPREPISMLDLARRIVALTGSASRIEFVPHRGEDVFYRSPSIAKAARLLDYRPVHALEEGLAKTIAWFRTTRAGEPR
jgi:nucleoside-diphosphate-sugar epimerase